MINVPAVQHQQQQQLSTPTKHDPKHTPKSSNATPQKNKFVTPDKYRTSQQQQLTPKTKPRPSDAVDQRARQLGFPAKTHEEFKNQLVHDVFGRDNKGRVPMEKVVMLIWQFRDDPAVVQFMAQFVGKVRLSDFFVLIYVLQSMCECRRWDVWRSVFSLYGEYAELVFSLESYLNL